MMNSNIAGIANTFMLLFGLIPKIIFGSSSPVMSTNNVDNIVWHNKTMKSFVNISGKMFIIQGSNILAMAIP
jgi:hypothetical protein